MSEPVIETQGLRSSYGDRTVLDGVDPSTIEDNGPRFIVAEQGLGPALIHYFVRSRVEGEVAVGEWPPESAFDEGPVRRCIMRITELPKRMRPLMAKTPGLTTFLPAGPGVAVEMGYRHPVALRACPVFDPNGDQVGRIRDAVARLRTTNRPPQIVGLVAEMPMRRRIFLPIGRITSLDADAVVLSTGTLNLRRFEKRPNELLVIEELLDRRVTITATGREAAVVDLAMEANRTGEWSLTRVAVREVTGRLTRRGHLHQLEWGEVTGLLGLPDLQGTASLLAVLDQMRPADLANVLQDLSDTRRNEVAAALDDERLADVLEELPERDQVEILAALDRERAADVLEEMDPDDAADLLAELPKPEQERLLGLMQPDEAQPVRALLDAGARVGLGVYGSASNERSDLFLEVKQALLVARGRGGGEAMTGREALRLGTRGGAEVLRRDDIGSLEPGKQADLAIWATDGLELGGAGDLVAGLVFSGPHRVDRLVVGGEDVVRGGALVNADEAQIAAEQREQARRFAT